MIVAGVFTPSTKVGLHVLHRLLLYSLLVVAPLLLGSNRPLFWGINGVVSALAIAALAQSELARPESSRLDWHIPRVALLGILIMGMWIAIQASPWTPQSLHHPIWFASPALAVAKGAISADPSQTWQALSWWSTLSIFIVAVRIGTDTKQRTFLLELMLSMCVLISAFGFLVEHYQLATLGLFPKVYYRGWLTGTFVNRNSAASFIGIGLIIALGLASRKYASLRSQTTRFSIFDLADTVISRTGLYSIAALWLFFALLLTGSRGGISAGIVGCTLIVFLRALKAGRLNASVVAAILGGLAITVALSVKALETRTDAADSTSVRISLYKEAMRAIADRPILGHGAGTFGSIQPHYHSSTTPSNVVWDNAHSTVLEIIITLGVPAVALAVTILGYIFLSVIRTWRNKPNDLSIVVITLAASTAVTLHAFIDFSLEIQAIAIYVACLLGLSIGETMFFGAQRSSHRRVPAHALGLQEHEQT
jgi:O-antigen ligase